MKKTKSKLNKIVLVTSLVFCFLLLLGGTIIVAAYNKYNLDYNQLTRINNGIIVHSASDTELNKDILHNTNRSVVEIESLPPYVADAFVAVEDKRFYKHNGFDLKRIAKAFWVNTINQSKEQGASTISQQLIKNAILSNEKTYTRKVKEVVLAVKMEKKFSKQEILEMYLNTIYFGSNSYGIENASKTFFNKSAKDLSLNEACCLAGIIKSPSLYSPKTNNENCNKRKNLVANLLYSSGKITKKELEEVLNTDIKNVAMQTFDNSYEEEAIYEACKLLNTTEREIINKGYQIVTFKDNNLQNKVAEINKNIINNNSNNSKLDSLSIVADNKGHIIAYYSNSNYNLHNLSRQPASALKPFAVYLPCITHNILSPISHILDEEINYNGYSPKNADNKYHGYVTAEFALSHSLNVPAVKLLDCVGVKKAEETLTNFGINISKQDCNLSLALGCTKNGVKLLDLLASYNTLSNLGTYKNLTFVNKILDKDGKVIYSCEDYEEKVAKEEDCFILNEMLKQTAQTGTAKRLESLNLPVCSKTGTASTEKGNTDLYNISYTSEHSVLTWVADIKNTYVDKSLLSSVVPTEINKQIFSNLYANKKPKDFSMPKNVVKLPYSVLELENNHIITAPTENESERFINYSYFKVGNEPSINTKTTQINFNYQIDKNGFNLQLMAEKNKVYNIYKTINGTTTLLECIKNKNENVTINDYNIFKYDTIEYHIEEQNFNIISEKITIKPKEYLINYLNNELLSNKKKWYV